MTLSPAVARLLNLGHAVDHMFLLIFATAVTSIAPEFGFDRWDAYMMLSQCGKVRLGNFVDPKYTVGAGILKEYLKP